MPTPSKSQREVLDALADVINVEPHSEAVSPVNGTGPLPTSSFSGQVPVSLIDSQPAVPTKDTFDPLGADARNRRPSEKSSESDTAPPLPTKVGGFGRFANAFRRHHTDEKDQKRREKERRMQRAISDSSRMDVIDRMDLSGLGSTLFHHDSPYDACSPHSNRNQRRAPVHAFDHSIDPMTGLPIANAGRGGASNGGGASHGRPGLSPLAAATMRKMTDSAGDVPDDGKGTDLLSKSSRSRSQPTHQMPTLGRNATTSSAATSTPSNAADGDAVEGSSSASMHSTIDRDVEAERAYRSKKGYMTQSSGNPRGRADVSNPNADVWGVTSEPWQDFAQPVMRLEPPSRGSLEGGGGSAASSVFDMEAVMTGKQRAQTGNSLSPAPSSSTFNGGNDGPKRSRSLMKRIKNARQYGNVPPPDEDVVERAEARGAPVDPRHTVRHQHKYSPSTPPLSSTATQSAGVQLSDNGPLPRSETVRPGNNAFSSAQTTDDPNRANGNVGRSGSIFTRFRGKNRDRDGLAAR